MTQRRTWGELEKQLSMSSLFAMLYAIIASNAVAKSPLFGGALFLCGQIAVLFFTSFLGAAKQMFPQRFRLLSGILLTVLMLAMLTLVVVIPRQTYNENTWIVFALVITILARDTLSDRIADDRSRLRIKKKWFITLIVLMHVIAIGVAAWVLLFNLDPETALPLFYGYLICDGLELIIRALQQRKGAADRLGDTDPEDLAELHDQLRGTNSFHVYEVLAYLIVMAVEMSTILCFAFAALASRDNMLITLIITGAVALVFYKGADYVLLYWERRHGHVPDPTYVLLFGLMLWLWGINLFRSMMNRGSLGMYAWVDLGFCAAGGSLCLSALNWLERAMQSVARYAAGGQSDVYRSMRAVSMKVAVLLGQIASLGVLTWMAFQEQNSAAVITAQPILLLPAIVLVVSALFFTLRFPLSTRSMDKLDRLLDLREHGSDNHALADQMEKVVVQKSRQPFATSLLRAVLKRIDKHRLVGTENIHPDDDNPIVFLCNHGEYYGPIAAMANIPVSVRPWTIAQISIDRAEVTQYIYENSFCRITWIPRKLRHPTARFAAWMLLGCMRQLQGIPVYRDNPIYLKRTFRDSVNAMLAGDNLVIFPENPNADESSPGYETDHVGSFFSGFVMLGKMYYDRCGRCCRFLPMYASKQTRTIYFGEELVFDPSANIMTEMKRISDSAEQWRKDVWARVDKKDSKETD